MRLPPDVVSPNEKANARHYWGRSLSALVASCKENSNQKILRKIADIQRDRNNTTNRRIIQQYDNNLKVLSTFRDFMFSDLLPKDWQILPKGIKKGEIIVHGFEIRIQISIPFSFIEKDVKKMGAIWFVAVKNGYTSSQLGVFAELAHVFLKANYSGSFWVCPENIIIVDALTTRSVNYSMIQSGRIPSQLQETLREIQAFLR